MTEASSGVPSTTANPSYDAAAYNDVVAYMEGAPDRHLMYLRARLDYIIEQRNRADDYVWRIEDEGWDPWAELRSRPHIRFIWRSLRAETGGIWRELPSPYDPSYEIALDGRQCADAWARAATLTHELIHDERVGDGSGVAWGQANIGIDEMAVEEAEVRRLTRLRMAFYRR